MHKYVRSLEIYAEREDVADKLQLALQTLIDKSKPEDIKNLANALSQKPGLLELALNHLPNIK